MLSRRAYLSDAVFVAAVTGPDELISRITDALDRPHWAPYLGRRSCIPDEPLVMRAGVADPVAELLHGVPLSAEAPRDQAIAHRNVDFWWDHAPEGLPPQAHMLDISDVPESFATTGSRYSFRRLYRTVERVPTQLCAGGPALHQRLIEYATGAPA